MDAVSHVNGTLGIGCCGFDKPQFHLFLLLGNLFPEIRLWVVCPPAVLVNGLGRPPLFVPPINVGMRTGAGAGAARTTNDLPLFDQLTADQGGVGDQMAHETDPAIRVTNADEIAAVWIPGIPYNHAVCRRDQICS